MSSKIGSKIQAGFDAVRAALEPIENRWVTLAVVVFFLLIFRAVGAAGFSDLIALVYIMYWVTFNRPQSS